MLRSVITVLAVLSAAGVASAQDSQDDGWQVTVGAGGLYAPSYEGDDDYQLSALPSVQVRYGDRFFASVENGVGYNWMNTETLRAGPIGRVRFSRDEDGDKTFAIAGDDTDDLQGLGDVDTSIELGGFVEYDIGALTLGAEARQAVNGHEGFIADVNAEWSGRASGFGPPVFWSIGPRARFVDDSYTSAYFGVDAAQSLASGLPVYEAGGGLHSYGVGASALLPLSEDLAIITFAGYDRFTGDAADSPMVQQRGSENQASVGVFVSYRIF